MLRTRIVQNNGSLLGGLCRAVPVLTKTPTTLTSTSASTSAGTNSTSTRLLVQYKYQNQRHQSQLTKRRFNSFSNPWSSSILATSNNVQCQRNYHILQQLNLNKKTRSGAITRSIIGHKTGHHPSQSNLISLYNDKNNSNIHKIITRNYIFFETDKSKFKQIFNSAKSILFGKSNNSNKNQLILQKQKKQRKQIMIRLKNNTKEQMKTQIERMKKRVLLLEQNNPRIKKSIYQVNSRMKNLALNRRRKNDTNRRRFKQWKVLKQSKITNYYKHKRSIIRHGTLDIWKKIRKQKDRLLMKRITVPTMNMNMKMKDWVRKSKRNARNASQKMSNMKLKNAQDWKNIKNWILYSNHAITINEPFQKEWFSDHGYPLTSRDPRSGRFVNPWKSESTNGLKRVEEVWRWKKTRMLGYDMTHGVSDDNDDDDSDNDGNDEKSTIPMQLAPPSSSDKIKMTWVGHATMLIQLSGFTILTDPVFSNKASPIQYFSESEFFGVPRRLPPSLSIDDIPSVGIDVCLISHDHYDHLDYDSVLQLTAKKLVKYWVVPLGMKEWLMKEAGVKAGQIVELEWWQSVKFKNNGDDYFSKDNKIRMKDVTNVLEWSPVCVETSLEKILDVDKSKSNDGIVSKVAQKQNQGVGANEMVITCAPAQHWCSRSPFDRNTRLWCSWAVHSSVNLCNEEGLNKDPKNLSFYFAGDTGYPKSFPLHRQIGDRLGPFDLAAIPIGAYKPRFFMHDSHCDPFESVNIHQDIRSKKSVAIHWGTFPLANEPWDEPPQVLCEAVDLKSGDNEKGDAKVDFTTISNGQSIESLS
jgi:N-acyl-phosphatidylethanolamine-hydrolysing phospholipase D